MVTTLCDEDTAKFHAGTDVDTTITSAEWTELINQAEGAVCMESRYNWIDDYAGLNDDYKKILELAAAVYAANLAIKHNMKVYSSIAEAQTLLNVNTYKYERVMARLKEKQFVDFVKS